MKKKILCLLLGFSLCLISIPFPSYANAEISDELDNLPSLNYEDIISMENSTISTEYEILESLKGNTVLSLKNMGYSNSEVNELKNKSIKELMVEGLNKLPDELLLERGLSVDEIKNVREHNIGEFTASELRAYSSNLALSIGNKRKSDSAASFAVYWAWSSRPALKFTDKIAAAFSDGFNATGNCTAQLEYKYDSGYPTNTSSQRINASGYPSSGVIFDLPLGKYTSNGPMYLYRGKAYIQARGNYTPSSLHIMSSYVHSHTPGTTISISAGYGAFQINIHGPGSEMSKVEDRI